MLSDFTVAQLFLITSTAGIIVKTKTPKQMSEVNKISDFLKFITFIFIA